MTETKERIPGYFCDHFRRRLSERYGIEITEAEYYDLCKQEKSLLYKISPTKRFGTIDVKGSRVFIVYSLHSNLINTCIRPHRLPMPNVFRKTTTYEKFHSDFLKHHRYINQLKKWIASNQENPDWKKRFFTTKIIHGEKEWYKGLAFFLYLNETTGQEKRIWTNEFMESWIREYKRKITKPNCKSI